ncbi:MAG: HlyD family efflux transporter periplasmic adaptor subunit [Victivallaceae bacterium]|nr:HlyD family efflux transporter periplasmic adaptor subunit [Victivallaceae bacterium]
MKKVFIAIAILAVAGLFYYGYRIFSDGDLGAKPDLAGGNGRIEATEISIAAKVAGRVELISAREGDFVTKGQLLAKMQTNVLEATLEVARAQREVAQTKLVNAEAQVSNSLSALEAAKANAAQKESLFDGAKKTFNRASALLRSDVTSKQKYEDAETGYLSAEAALNNARASVKQAEAALASAQAGVNSAKANIALADATISVVNANIDDSYLTAPLDGRIQYRIAEPGEVIGAGGRVLNLIDLTDVYMTFFLPETAAGKISLGDDVRILLDALPEFPIPAKVSYVADVAQFTPKTVETKIERQKLMFRIKARIDPELLKAHTDMIKTGIPGVAWVKINRDAPWPAKLELKPLK